MWKPVVSTNSQRCMWKLVLSTASVARESQCCQQLALHVKASGINKQPALRVKASVVNSQRCMWKPVLSTASVACESQCCQQPELHVKVSVVNSQRCMWKPVLSTASVACESQCCQQPALHVKVSVVNSQRCMWKSVLSTPSVTTTLVDKQLVLMWQPDLLLTNSQRWCSNNSCRGERGGGGGGGAASVLLLPSSFCLLWYSCEKLFSSQRSRAYHRCCLEVAHVIIMTEIKFAEETFEHCCVPGYDVLKKPRSRKTTEGQDRYQSSALRFRRASLTSSQLVRTVLCNITSISSVRCNSHSTPLNVQPLFSTHLPPPLLPVSKKNVNLYPKGYLLTSCCPTVKHRFIIAVYAFYHCCVWKMLPT